MKLLWVTDAWDTLDHPRDTTLRLIQESLSLGLRAWWCDPSGLRFESGSVLARCRSVTGAPPDRGASGWHLEEPRDVELATFDQVHYRTDPPVDCHYWEHLQLLVWASAGGRPAVVNPPAVIALHGDKLGPGTLARALPPTVVTSSWECLRTFGRAEGRTVLKPLGGAQSRGVQLLDWSAPDGVEHARRAIEELSRDFARPVMLQRFLPDVYAGEKRLWFVDGELLACVRKRPHEGTFVIDMDKGSACEPCELGSAEERLARAIGETFRSQKVRLAAVDVIGGYVTDWNLTSPGMIPMMERVLGRNLARPIVEALTREPHRSLHARSVKPSTSLRTAV
jgi:glutathione synthase